MSAVPSNHRDARDTGVIQRHDLHRVLEDQAVGAKLAHLRGCGRRGLHKTGGGGRAACAGCVRWGLPPPGGGGRAACADLIGGGSRGDRMCVTLSEKASAAACLNEECVLVMM